MGFWVIVLVILMSAVLGFLFFLFLSFVLVPIFWGAPFLPTDKERIERALRLVNLKPGQKIADLGAGDGRILIACAKKGAKAYGFEINPFLVWKAKSNLKREKVQNLAICQQKSFWNQDFSSFDVVFVYGISHIMKKLEKKLQKELKHGSKVVSFVFSFPNWQPQIKENGIYVYNK
ncbi:methyltransferase domain-containing protein [Patescibacteria group bacterium]|nr:methyltransferase domain-containing protein [Patescibacteria group bacterium]